MNTVTIENDLLVVEPRGVDKVLAMRRRLEVPLAHVLGATHDPGFAEEPKGVRAPGTHLPGKVAGTFHRHGEKTFWNVSKARSVVVIALHDDELTRLVLSVEDPRSVVAAVNAAADREARHRLP